MSTRASASANQKKFKSVQVARKEASRMMTRKSAKPAKQEMSSSDEDTSEDEEPALSVREKTELATAFLAKFQKSLSKKKATVKTTGLNFQLGGDPGGMGAAGPSTSHQGAAANPEMLWADDPDALATFMKMTDEEVCLFCEGLLTADPKTGLKTRTMTVSRNSQVYLVLRRVQKLRKTASASGGRFAKGCELCNLRFRNNLFLALHYTMDHLLTKGVTAVLGAGLAMMGFA